MIGQLMLVLLVLYQIWRCAARLWRCGPRASCKGGLEPMKADILSVPTV
jgi:hypothetical protein